MGAELAPEDLQDQSVALTPAESQSASQPAFQPNPVKLDEQAVRQAMRQASDSGVDPFSLAVGDLTKTDVPEKRVEPPQDIPEKFKKPNGEVDVEKLKASTRQLDEVIQKKETEVQKTVDEMFSEYKAKEQKFRAMPNPERLAAQVPLPPPPLPMTPNQLSDEQLEQMINADISKNPARVMAEFTKLQLEKMIGPILEERKDNVVRENIKALASKDPRILNPQVYAAVNAKLDADPDLWKLKNPHKAAWLEVKEDMRLGELPNGNPAQPSKPSAPILGGGTPPPAPSLSSEAATREAIFQAADQLGRDPRDRKYDPKQQAAVDQAAKKFFDDLDRNARRF